MFRTVIRRWDCALALLLTKTTMAQYDCMLMRMSCHTFTIFGNAPVDSFLGHVGPGGHMLVLALVRCLALLVSGIDEGELQLPGRRRLK